MSLRSGNGFTILEVLIVLVILAVLSGLAFPVVTAQIERSRATEAIQHLDAVGDHMKAYRGFNGNYTGATWAAINYNPNGGGGGQTLIFTYALVVNSPTSYTCTAQREPAADHAGDTVVLNQVGDVTTVTRNGVYQ